MLTFVYIKNIYSFFELMRDKGFSCCLDFDNDFCFDGRSNIVIYFDFEVDSYEYIEKLVKDWILFHTDLVCSYQFEICENGFDCRCNLNVRERFL